MRRYAKLNVAVFAMGMIALVGGLAAGYSFGLVSSLRDVLKAYEEGDRKGYVRGYEAGLKAQRESLEGSRASSAARRPQ